MEMARLSEAMIRGLRKIAAGDVHEVNKRTRDALRSRFLIKWDGDPAAWQITPSGRAALDEIERAEKAKQGQAERASRPVPAGAFVEPSARTAPVMGLEYDEDEPDSDEPEEPMCREGDDEPHPIGSPECILTQLAEGEHEIAQNGIACAICGAYLSGDEDEPDSDLDESVEIPADHRTEREKREADEPFTESGPSVQLTPRPEDVEQEATDAEILQLLTMLDHGASVHRGLYQEYGVLDAGPFRLNLDAVNRAARDAVRFGLARQTYSDRLYRLEVEPIHLLTGDGQVTPCGRYPEAARKSGKRLRVTADPSKVTHDFCQE